MKMQITLTPEEIERIVRESLTQKFKIVGDIEMVVGQELRGHYTNEHYATVFNGAKCEVEM